MILHPKIKELKLRSRPIEYSDVIVVGNIPKYVEQLRSTLKLTERQNAFYFCIWGVRDTYGTGWIKGAFSKSIRERGPESQANQKIFVSWMHNVCDPIGRCLSLVEDEVGAYAIVEWDDPEAVPNAKRAMSQIKSGTINGYSFGFRYVWDKMEYDEAADTIWTKEADLFEVTPVTMPSMTETYTIRSAEQYESEKFLLDEDTQEFLRSLPKTKQLELRQLLQRHITLTESKPGKPLEESKPEEGLLVIGDLKINVKQF